MLYPGSPFLGPGGLGSAAADAALVAGFGRGAGAHLSPGLLSPLASLTQTVSVHPAGLGMPGFPGGGLHRPGLFLPLTGGVEGSRGFHPVASAALTANSLLGLHKDSRRPRPSPTSQDSLGLYEAKRRHLAESDQPSSPPSSSSPDDSHPASLLLHPASALHRSHHPLYSSHSLHDPGKTKILNLTTIKYVFV